MPNIDLGQHVDSVIQEQLASGRFQDASEVGRAALRLLEDQATTTTGRRADLRATVNEAFDDFPARHLGCRGVCAPWGAS